MEKESMKNFHIGIDIAKKSFVSAIRVGNKEKTKTFNNRQEGFEQLLVWLKIYSSSDKHFCMESTGKYGNALALFLYENNYKTSIVNPVRIKYFMKSNLVRNKTDVIDAKLILRYSELYIPIQWHPLPEEIQDLQALVKRRDTLLEMELRERNRLENIEEIIMKSVHSTIEYLTKERKAIAKEIQHHIAKHIHLKQKFELVNSIPGIGEKTASKIVAFLGNVETFKKAKHLAAYVGLNPQQHKSGSSVNGRCRLSKTGDGGLRKMLYMPALVAIKHNPILHAFYHRLLARGKLKKVAVCAVMRKLVHIIYGVLSSNQPFNPYYEKNIK